MAEEVVKRPRGRPRKVVEQPQPKKPGRPKKVSIAEKEQRAIEQEKLAAEKAAEPPKKSAGRPKNSNFLPFAEAREIVQAELLHSRGAYERWFEREKPKTIPRFPYRVYKEWTTWNDFLGTSNEFKQGAKSWRPFLEAIHIVHALQLKTQRDWLTFCKEHPDQIPDDIPRRPDVVYDQWVSWAHWLGNKPVEAVKAKVEAAKTAVYYIIREQGAPLNVFTYGVEQAGLSAMRDWHDREKFDVIKMFWYEADRANDAAAVVHAFSTPYLGEERQRITPNVWAIVEQLQMMMSTIIRGQ